MLIVLRRWAIVATLALSAAPAYADHPVTIVLRSGEQMTGRFADLHNNLVYVRTNQDRESRVPLSDIAVIDFTNGQRYERDPQVRSSRQAEHVLVLRNGRRIEGRFEGLTGDDQPHRGDHPLEFVFRTVSGDYVRVNADRVARLYLAEPRDVDSVTTDGVTVWLEDGTSMQGALTGLDARTLAIETWRSGGGAARRSLTDVAVIDFEGNRQRIQDERWGDPRGDRAPHLLVMRNGRRLSGEFIGPARRGDGGESSYLFRSTNGRIVTFTPATASRLYLGRTDMVAERFGNRFGDETPIEVSAQQNWTDTNIIVRRGDVLVFRARGEVQLSADGSDRARPGGSATGRRAPSAPIRDANAGALIGRVGSTVFLIGDGEQGVRMPASGELFLGINDDHFPDNRGAYQVIVRRDATVSP
jgi:small nuclear ribonucleoprotein (snRNP)-like protein